MSNKLILKEENVTIICPTTKDAKKDGYDLEIVAQKMIKHLKRYQSVELPFSIASAVLLYSLKGMKCDSDHLDISQRHSIYHFLKDKNLDDPYIKQFLKETEEKHAQICL